MALGIDSAVELLGAICFALVAQTTLFAAILGTRRSGHGWGAKVVALVFACNMFLGLWLFPRHGFAVVMVAAFLPLAADRPEGCAGLVWLKRTLFRRRRPHRQFWRSVDNDYRWVTLRRRQAGTEGAATELVAADVPAGRGTEPEASPAPAGRGTEPEGAPEARGHGAGDMTPEGHLETTDSSPRMAQRGERE